MKCKYCGHETEGSGFCNDICRTEYDSYIARGARLEGKGKEIVIGIIIISIVIVAVMLISPVIGVILMALAFLIPVKYPYVTEETLTVMSVRGAVLLLRLICIIFAAIIITLLLWMLL